MSDPFYATRNAFSDRRRQEDADAQAQQQNALARQAGGQMATGDFSGASGTLYRGGQLDAGMKVAGAGEADRKREAEGLSKFTEGVQRLIDSGVDPQKAWEAGAHYAPQLGLNPAHIQQAAPLYAQDPKGFLAFANAAAKKEIEQYTLSPGSRRYDANGKLIAESPFAPQYRTVGEGQSLVAVGGDQPQAAPQPQGGDWLAGVSQAAPDAQVTSGLRTPQHNTAVGGVPNSEHLSGKAVDLVPRPGETMAQLYARVRGVPGVKAINEGDHVHVQAQGGAQTQGGARVIAQGAPKQAAVPSGYKANPDGSLSFIPGGPADPATKTSAGLKPIPAKIQQGYADNAKGMTQIDQAIAEIRGNPGALGGSPVGFIRNALGDNVSQRVDPGGVKARAALANIGSLIIHDRSGAAVTAAETPRLLPFIPQVTDTPETAIKKLQGLKDQYRNANDQIEVQFGEESGYRPLGVSSAPSGRPAAPNARAPGGATPPPSALKVNHITTFANGQKWTLRGGKPQRVQ